MCTEEQYLDERPFPVTFTLQERKLILHLRALDGNKEERFRHARMRGNSIAVPMNAYDVYDLLEQIAAVATREKNLKLRRQLGRLHKKLESVLDSVFPF